MVQICVETGKVLAEFQSQTEAGKSVGGSSSINSVCNGHCHTAGGYFWRFKGSDRLPGEEHRRVYRKWLKQRRDQRSVRGPRVGRTKTVEQVCKKTGAVVAEFESPAEAAGSFGISTDMI